MKSIQLLLVIGFIFLQSSCVSGKVNYIGQSHGLTDHVDVFYDEKKINQVYEIMGHAIGIGSKMDAVEKKLIERAKLEGADAILITSLGNENNNDGYSSIEINASFIKY